MRSLFTAFAVFALAATVLWWGANNSTVNAGANVGDEANSPAATFAANAGTLGAIADAPATGCADTNYGTPRDVTFNVSGVSGNVTNVSVSMNLVHTWVGDLQATLKAPGGSPSFVLFDSTGSTTAGGCGFSSDLVAANALNFSDSASTNWWTAASTNNVVAGNYRTTPNGGAGVTNPPTPTTMNAAFSSLTAAQANGTWTLTMRDGGGGDTGSITAASLTVEPTSAPSVRGKLFDFTGNGRTDFTTLQFPTGGAINWTVVGNPASSTPNQALIRRFDFGSVATDTVVPRDFYGDQKSEVAVYRDSTTAGAAGTYYQAQFQTGSAGFTVDRATPFGLSTDVISAEGDYDGDTKEDYTAVRVSGSTLIWYILSSGTNTVKGITFGQLGLTGTTGYSVFQGADFTGDGRDELIYVYRNTAGTIVTYNVGDSNTGAVVRIENFGNFNSDFSVSPDDYTGDGKADLVAVRETNTGTGGQATWYIRDSATGNTSFTNFGIADPTFTDLDVPVRGDYDGDGRHDIAVYRDSNSTFYYISSAVPGTLAGQQTVAAFGSGDTPLGSFGLY